MPIPAHCPQCRATFNLADELAGKVVRCSACSGTFRVPQTSAPAASEPLRAVLVDDPPAPAPRQAPQPPSSAIRTQASRQAAPAEPAPPPQPAPIFPLREVLINTGAVLGVIVLTWVIGAIVVALRSGS
jgi:predicted Zn finger-like uncharacterized protein